MQNEMECIGKTVNVVVGKPVALVVYGSLVAGRFATVR